jgi:hypothetical protein
VADVKLILSHIAKGSDNITKAGRSLDKLGVSADKAKLRTAALNAKQQQLAKQVAKGNITLDQATAKYGKFKKSLPVEELGEAGKSTRSLTDKIKANWQQIAAATAAVVAFGIAAKKAFDFAQEGAQIKQLGESFDLMNKQVFKTPGLLDKLREASRGTISDVSLMSGLMTLTAGTSQEMSQAFASAAPKLLEIAKAANKLNPTLGDTAFLYQSLSTGIKRSSPLILDNLGIVVKIGEANEKFAESIGKTVEELTAEEKQMALLNEVMVAGDRLITQVGGNVDSAADSYAQLTVEVQNLTNELKILAGVKLTPVVVDIVEGIEASRLTGELNAVAQEMGFTEREAYKLGEALAYAGTQSEDLEHAIVALGSGWSRSPAGASCCRCMGRAGKAGPNTARFSRGVRNSDT